MHAGSPARGRPLPPAGPRSGAAAAQPAVERAVRAITYGTYDLFHVGHVNLFRRIRERCDHLIVAVSTDEFNAIKGKRAVMSFADRCALVAACRYVDEVIAENGWDQKERDIVQHRADLFVMGDDWAGRFDHLSGLCRVLYLPRTEGVSSTGLKQAVTCPPRSAGALPPGGDTSGPAKPDPRCPLGSG